MAQAFSTSAERCVPASGSWLQDAPPRSGTLAFAFAGEFFPHPHLHYHFYDFFGMIRAPELRGGWTSLFKREPCIRTLKVKPPHVLYKISCLLPESRLLRIPISNQPRRWVFIPSRKEESRKAAASVLLFRVRNDVDLNRNTRPHISNLSTAGLAAEFGANRGRF